MEATFCVGCGAARVPGDLFCRSCGQSFAAAAAPAPSAAPMPAVPPAAQEPVASAQPVASAVPTGWPGPTGWPTVPATMTVRPRRSASNRAAWGCATLIIAVLVIGAIGAYLEGDTGGSGGGAGPGSPDGTATATEPSPTDSATWQATESPASEEPTPREVSLTDALAAQLVSLTATGKNLQDLSVTVQSHADETLAVTVPAGLLFTPASSATQPMVVTWAAVINVAPRGSETMMLSVACASMDLDQPDGSDSFTVSTTPAAADLQKLVGMLSFRSAEFRVQQFAIWTITNDPPRDGYVGLGSFGMGSGPDSEEIAQIKSLFTEAGIDPSRYQALR